MTGDPFGESSILVAVQEALLPGPGGLVAPVARGMSHFGEHSLGWLGIAGLGFLVDRPRRTQWVGMGVAAFTSHAASVVLKRIVRRPRPHREDIVIGVGTPSALSFPSSHATSTTAGLLYLDHILGSKVAWVGVPLMMASRMVLGVHYPTDVTAGALLGATTYAITRSRVEGANHA